MMNGYFLNNPRLVLGQYARMSIWNGKHFVVRHFSRIDSIFRIIDFVVGFLGQIERTNAV